MASEYDPFLAPSRPRFESSNLEAARDLFHQASRPYMVSPVPWLVWSIILPAVALSTPAVARAFDWVGVLLLWSLVILIGGFVELSAIRYSSREVVSTPLASWAFGAQGNLSLVAIALSFFLLWTKSAWALPGLWLLLLGHSFVVLGGLAFSPLRTAGLVYQIGGVAALWPSGEPLIVLAATTFAANLWMAISVWRSDES